MLVLFGFCSRTTLQPEDTKKTETTVEYVEDQCDMVTSSSQDPARHEAKEEAKVPLLINPVFRIRFRLSGSGSSFIS